MRRKIYPDSCVLIYRLQCIEPWAGKISQAFEPLEEIVLYVTDLTRLECRVLPCRQGDEEMLEIYERFFTRSDIRKLALSSQVFGFATELRASATTQNPRCHSFVGCHLGWLR